MPNTIVVPEITTKHEVHIIQKPLDIGLGCHSYSYLLTLIKPSKVYHSPRLPGAVKLYDIQVSATKSNNNVNLFSETHYFHQLGGG